jgi:hypothetical protein
MSYRKIYNQIETLEPRPRGTAFENLINKIFEDNEILINARYRTDDTQQEIDGAILLFNKVFLIEVKWEKSETLAASKLYSFLGKINSKIEGTLGVFISYNELSPNFVDSVRNGIRQNCILIHGKKNIEDIIDEKINIKDFIEYCFIQASTRNVISINTSQFLSLPIHKTVNKSISKQQTQPKNLAWLNIYKSLVGKDSLSDFSAVLTSNYSDDLGLSNNILDIYNTLEFNLYVKEKFVKLIEKLISEEKEMFTSCLIKKFKGNDWLSYADEHFCVLLQKYKLDIKEEDRIDIVSNVTSVIGNGNWEPENKATYVIDVFYNKLSSKEKDVLLNKFLEIYCDTSRMEKFAQKQFAQRLFTEYKRIKSNYIPVIKDMLFEDLKSIRISEEMYLEEGFKSSDLKTETLKSFKRKYNKVFEDNAQDIELYFKEEYKKI